MRAETATAPAPCAAAWAAISRGNLVRALVDVGEEQDRLGGERAEVARGAGSLLGQRHGAHGPPGLQRSDDLVQPGLFGDGDTVSATGVFGDPLDAPFGLLEVGKRKLELDGLDVAQRVHVALGVHDARVAVGAHDVHERVGLADVGEEAVAEALPPVRAGDEPGDVVKVDGVVDDLRRAQSGGHLVQTPVHDGHHGDVGLDRGERVVGGLHPRAGERVEERGLAGVGQPDDADASAHRATAATAVPNSVPASTSEG